MNGNQSTLDFERQVRMATGLNRPCDLYYLGFAMWLYCLFCGHIAHAAEIPIACQEPSPIANTKSSGNHSWDFVRGPNFDGVSLEVGLLDRWPEKGPPIVWHRTVGQGFSSFTGKHNRVFTQYQTLSGQYLVCLDAHTGDTIWEYRHSWPFDPAGLYPGPQSTPTLDDDHVYFTSPKGLLGCLRQDNGEVLWQIDLMERFGAKPVEFGYSCSPVLVDGVLLMPVGGPGVSMVAIRAADGTTVWKSGNEPISHASALPIQLGDRELVVGYFKNAIQLFDRIDGTLLTTLELSSGYDEHSSWPIYKEPRLWISAPFRAGSMWLEVSDDPWELQAGRATDLMSNDVCSSVLYDNALFGFDILDVQSKVHRPSRGQFRCLDFQSGKELWSNGVKRDRRAIQDPIDSTASSLSIGHASLIIADGKLIMLNDTGDLIMAWADRNSYREIGRSRLLGGEIGWTQPMLLNGRLYVRDHHRMVCAFIGNPEQYKLNQGGLVGADELPIRKYRNWSAMILSVEPEYAMTAPSQAWLIQWFWVSLGLGWLIAPILGIVCWALATGTTRANASHSNYLIWTGSAFVMGILGTTWLSHWFGSFLFTWQLSLAILFQWLIRVAKIRRGDKSHPIGGRVLLAAFLIFTVGYFVVCRRLSLAFEWCFLMGFPAAVPFLLLERRLQSTGWKKQVAGWFLTAVAYAAFYWMGAGIMLWWYRG